jgi:hypothetical protein
MNKFRRVFTGDAAALRRLLVEHFKKCELDMQHARDRLNPHGTDYAAGLHAGEQHGYREAWRFIQTVEIAELVE